MSRLIDADKAKEVLTKLLYETALNNSGGASLMCEDIAENRLETWFGLVPTVDAVEVVRCKDCYYCATEKSFGKVYHYCEAFEQYAEGDLIGVSLQVNPDHFCSWGERKEDADT